MFTATPKVIKMKIKIIPFRIRFVQHFPTLQRRQSRILVIPLSSINHSSEITSQSDAISISLRLKPLKFS